MDSFLLIRHLLIRAVIVGVPCGHTGVGISVHVYVYVTFKTIETMGRQGSETQHSANFKEVIVEENEMPRAGFEPTNSAF